MSPSERAAVDQAHRQFGEPTATPKPRAGEHTKWGAMAVGDEGALIFHWRATGMSSDGGIGDYVELRAHQRLEAEHDSLAAQCRELIAEVESLRAFKRGVDAALNSGDGAYRP